MKKYRFAALSKTEIEFLEMVLMEEIGLQDWFAMSYSGILNEEVFLCKQ